MTNKDTKVAQANSEIKVQLFCLGFVLGVFAVLCAVFMLDQHELLVAHPVGVTVACLVAGLLSGALHRS